MTNAGRGDDTVSDQRDWLQITLSSIGDGVIMRRCGGPRELPQSRRRDADRMVARRRGRKAVEQVFRIIYEDDANAGRTAGQEGHRAWADRRARESHPAHRKGRQRAARRRYCRRHQGCPGQRRGGRPHLSGYQRHGGEAQHRVEWSKEYAESIVAAVREPMLILDTRLHVQSANRSFYRTFQVNPAETEGRFIYDLGDGQWNIPALRMLLEEIVPRNSAFDDFEVEHDFEHIGRKTMLLNARRFPLEGRHELVLLSIEDVTDRMRIARELKSSEVRYRRLFEAAHDGILLVDPDAEESRTRIRSWSSCWAIPSDELVGKELWKFGLLRDEEVSREAFRTLRETGSIRYEDLPLRSKDGKQRDVEFVSNVYKEDDRDVIQCNIRDITDRMRLEEERKRHQQAAEAARDRAEAQRPSSPTPTFARTSSSPCSPTSEEPARRRAERRRRRHPLGHEGEPRMEQGRHRPAGRQLRPPHQRPVGRLPHHSGKDSPSEGTHRRHPRPPPRRRGREAARRGAEARTPAHVHVH